MEKRKLTYAAQVAKIIKSELKKLGLKVSVRSAHFSGGDSVDVYLEDVRPDLLEKIEERYSKYKMGNFDSMTDCYNYDNFNRNLPQVKYLFFNNKCSERLRECAEKYIEDFYGVPKCESVSVTYSSYWFRALRDENFWNKYTEFAKKQPKTCPKCGSVDMVFPALSRRDNKTEICSKCGQKEALEDMAIAKGILKVRK